VFESPKRGSEGSASRWGLSSRTPTLAPLPPDPGDATAHETLPTIAVSTTVVPTTTVSVPGPSTSVVPSTSVSVTYTGAGSSASTSAPPAHDADGPDNSSSDSETEMESLNPPPFRGTIQLKTLRLSCVS